MAITDKKYRLGKTYSRLTALCYAVTVLTGGLFFFIYQALYPTIEGIAIFSMVILLTTILIVLERKALRYGKENVYYVFTPEALRMHGLFGKVQDYEWKNFESVYMAKMAPYETCRVRFGYAGRELRLVKYIGDPNGLCLKIFPYIEDHVSIDPEIVRISKALSD